MNVFDSQKTFLTLPKKKSQEKIPEFLREILLKPSNSSRPESQGKLRTSFNTSRIVKKRKSCFASRAESTNKTKIRESTGSQGRVLYKPTVFSINPRSKVTLFTSASFRSGSEARFVNRRESDAVGENFKPKLRNRKVKYLVPEFRGLGVTTVEIKKL